MFRSVFKEVYIILRFASETLSIFYIKCSCFAVCYCSKHMLDFKIFAYLNYALMETLKNITSFMFKKHCTNITNLMF